MFTGSVPLTHGIYEVAHRDTVEKSHSQFMYMAWDNKWAWNGPGRRSRVGCAPAALQTAWLRPPTRGCLLLRTPVFAPIPACQGIPQLPPAPLKSCSSYQVESLGVSVWFSIQWHVIYELCSLIYDLYGWQRKQDQALGCCTNRDDT